MVAVPVEEAAPVVAAVPVEVEAMAPVEEAMLAAAPVPADPVEVEEAEAVPVEVEAAEEVPVEVAAMAVVVVMEAVAEKGCCAGTSRSPFPVSRRLETEDIRTPLRPPCCRA